MVLFVSPYEKSFKRFLTRVLAPSVNHYVWCVYRQSLFPDPTQSVGPDLAGDDSPRGDWGPPDSVSGSRFHLPFGPRTRNAHGHRSSNLALRPPCSSSGPGP